MRSTARWRWAIAALLAAAVVCAGADRALAYTWNCVPWESAHGSYRGTTYDHRLLWDIMRLDDARCFATVERLSFIDVATRNTESDVAGLRRDVNAVRGEVATLGGKLDGLEGRLGRIEAAVTGTIAVRVTNPVESGDAAAAIVEMRDWLRADLWLAMGLGCALFFSTYLVRVVMPRA